MAAEIEIFDAVVLTIDGVPFKPDIGSLKVSVKGVAASITTGKHPVYRRVKVPFSSQVTIWEWADTEGFTYMEVRPVGGAGFIQVGLRYNAATTPLADADLTPTGSLNHWKDLGKSCVCVFALDTERAYIHATAANAVAQSGSGTYPGVWGEAAKINAVCDAIALRNDSTDTDCYYDVLVIPK